MLNLYYQALDAKEYDRLDNWTSDNGVCGLSLATVDDVAADLRNRLRRYIPANSSSEKSFNQTSIPALVKAFAWGTCHNRAVQVDEESCHFRTVDNNVYLVPPKREAC